MAWAFPLSELLHLMKADIAHEGLREGAFFFSQFDLSIATLWLFESNKINFILNVTDGENISFISHFPP